MQKDNDEHIALVIFDSLKGHKGDELDSLLHDNNTLSVVIHSNCKVLLQPLHFSVNKPMKDHLCCTFKTWYSEQVTKQLWNRKDPEDMKVDLQLTVMKPLSTKWIISALTTCNKRVELFVVDS